MTVPNSPTNGAVEPTVARNAMPPDSLEVIAPWLRASEFTIQTCWSIESVSLWCSELAVSASSTICR